MNNKLVRVLVLSWISYATYYFLRVNFSIALPGIMEEFNISKVALGGAASTFFAMYAVGQFINGQLADIFGPKRLVALGLGVSIFLNLLIPSVGASTFLITILWGINGLFQSMGWSPNVKIVSAWAPEKLKGRAAGILGTSYIAGSALSWLLAGYLAKFNWRAVFYIPALLGIEVLVLWLKYAEESPEGEAEPTNLKETLVSVFTDKRVLLAGMGLFGLNIVRYGFLTWAPTYFFEEQGATITMAAYKALIFPMAGALGALSVGWLTDKIFQTRRTVVGLVMTIILSFTAVLFANTTSWTTGLILLAVIGFTTFGPHSLLVSQLPMIFGNNKNTASITGAIDALGYLGASLTGVISGWLIDNYSWTYAFYFWVFGGIVAGIFMYLSDKHGKNNNFVLKRTR
ncbi:MFS transporter [Patescibacteria group bacterium]